MNSIVLVQCVSKKGVDPCLAKDLYISTWFKKAKTLVENSKSDWFILSAKYHLLIPDELTYTYNKTLNNMRIKDRRIWSEKVIQQMERDLPTADTVVVFAGKKYRGLLMNYLNDNFKQVLVPMEGLGFGKQLKWLGDAKDIYG